MRIWHPFELLGRAAGGNRRQAGEMAIRWVRAFRQEPQMVADLIGMGGILTHRPVRLDQGVEMPDPIDPIRLAYEAGQRDMALRILALGRIDHSELRNLIDNNGDTP